MRTLDTKPNDLFSFPLVNGNFGAMICTEIINKKLRHYRFVPVIGKWMTSPLLEEIAGRNLAAVKIGSTMGYERTMALQPGVEALWPADEREGFFVGLAELTCKEKDWKNIRPKVSKIGTIMIKPAFNTMGALQYLESFDGLQNIFSDIGTYIENYQWRSFPINVLCAL